MSTIFSLRRTADEDGRTAGGKILRTRRARAAERTPYARPTPLPPPAEDLVAESSGNPNWLSGLIYPARAIASGAGKILSSVFGPDYLSSSSSSSGGDCFSEDDDDASNAADVDLNKALSSMDTKSENMQLIQQLVMQQTFSREECDELIKLIRSRVVIGDRNLSNTDACNNVVWEARKWLEERRSGSKLMVEDQICVTNHAALSQVTQSEMGSPVDMAKSYMQAQPTWSSPALKRVEFTTPSPRQNSKEFFRNPVQLAEMKGSALSAGSWNILDEIRRVRSKATEELLAKTPSKKINLTSDSLGDMSVQDTTTKNVNDKKIGDEMNSDPNISLGLPATNGSGLPEPVETECERSQDGELQTNNASSALKQCQDGETTQVIGDSDAANGTNPDVNSNQLDVVSFDFLSAPDQPLEQPGKEATNAVDSSMEKVDATLPDDHLIASQDSSSMAYEDSMQDVTTADPNHEGKNAPVARKLRPRNKSGKS
ncbi:hypothetical protein V2J09_007988 [Rumex salicifolius]